VASIPAVKLVEELNDIFGRFDDIMDEFQIEKIETIGDAYMAACGLPEENSNHALNCVGAAKRMISFLNERNRKSKIQWNMRVGIHSGPVVAYQFLLIHLQLTSVKCSVRVCQIFAALL